jgi:hypothetical protein
MSKRLITDRDVLAGAVRPPIVLDGQTLITPSARDRAVRLGWTIVEAGAPAAPPTLPSPPRAAPGAGAPAARTAGRADGREAGTTGTAAPRLDELADGLYLVRIEGGRRVSVLPAAGPGVLLRATAPGSGA